MTAVCDAIGVRDIRAALAICGRVVPARAVSETMRHVRLGDGAAEATDGEVRVRVAIGYAGEPVLLPFSRLEALARACTGDQLQIDTEQGQATIRASGGRWRLPTVDPAEWPAAADISGQPVARIPADQLRRGLEAVIAATDTESSRYALSGVKIEVTDGTVHLVATDGRRLYTSQIEIDQAVDDCQLLLPARAASLLLTLAKASPDEEIQLELQGEEVVAEVGDGLRLWARQLEGAFPKWRDAIPERPDASETVVRADELAQAIRQAAICSSETSRGIKLTLGNPIVAEATSSEHGKSRCEIEPIEADDAVTLTVDPRYCLDWLRAVDPAEPVTCEASDKDSALVLKVEDSTGVVMPMGADE